MGTKIVKLSSKNQIVIPSAIRKILGLQGGDRIYFEISSDGKIEVKKLPAHTPDSIIGILNVERQE